MKKSTILFLSLVLTAGFVKAEDVVTAGTGVTYTLESLSGLDGSGVAKDGKVYTMNNSVTISAGDRFELESGATIKMGTDVELRIEGTASLAATDRVLVTRADEEAEPRGIFMDCATAVTEVKNIDFEYAGLRNLSETGLDIENCSFRFNNGKMTTVGALGLGGNGASFVVKDCIFEYNTVPAIGGAVSYTNGIEIDNCTFTDNNTSNTNKPQVNLSAPGALKVVVKNSQFNGAERTMVGALAIANMMSVAGDNVVEIVNNDIKDHRYGVTLYGALNATIDNNRIIDNKYASSAMMGGAGISIYDYGTKPNVTVKNNTIEGNMWGITVIGGETVNIGTEAAPGHNKFRDNGNNGELYDLYNNSTLTVYAQGNNWGVYEQTEEKIETVIFHKNDDTKLGEVLFMPAWDGKDGVANVAADAARYANGVVTAEGASISVYTLSGALVKTAEGEADLKALAPGTYIVRVASAQGATALKCVR